MYITILGRQPSLGIAELEHFYLPNNVSWFSSQSALVDTDDFHLERLGGAQKAGRVLFDLQNGDWRKVSMQLVKYYTNRWSNVENKITLGISTYGFTNIAPRDVQKTGIILKQKMKDSNSSLRIIPNNEVFLSTATSHHNKLGLSDNKIEILVVRSKSGKIIVAESVGSQNITAYAKRDQERPKRDAFVGMLPPKLAQIMINLTTTIDTKNKKDICLLDPFCGTGVILQEALLMGYNVYGTDLSEKMVDFTSTNLEWIIDKKDIKKNVRVAQGDAMDTSWIQPIDTVACECYLGQPFSAPPSSSKLIEVRNNCNHIISSFLENIGKQIKSDTPLCLAVPAWRDNNQKFTHLPLIDNLAKLGYNKYSFKNIDSRDLLYFREDQVVARELLVLVKA